MSDTTPTTVSGASEPQREALGRREVLSGAATLAGGAAVTMIATRAEGSTEAKGGDAKHADYNWEEHKYAFLVDMKKCIGCGSCVRACKAENHPPDHFFRTWVERYLISAEGTAVVDSPNGAMEGFPPTQPPFRVTKGGFVPKLCNHCSQTPCRQVCPVGASYITKDGVVLVDDKTCIGCGYCVQACPYGSRYLNEETGCAEKCTWCYHRITKGLKPACVEVCPTGARAFGDMKREDDPVRQAIETQPVTVLQQHLLTEPQCYYLGLDKEMR